MSEPKRHHFIPQMLLRRFTDVAGHLYFANRRNPKAGVGFAKPENLLLEKHLYSTIQKDGKRDASLEQRYSKLEGAVSPLIDQITRCILNDTIPELNGSAKETWDKFLYEQWRRVPDMHNQVMPQASAKEAVREALDAFESEYRTLAPDERARSLTPHAVAEFRQNAKVGALSRSSGEVMKALAGKGLSFGVCEKRHSFIIGSSPILKIVEGPSSRLDDPRVEVWLPIHPNIVAVAAGKKGDATIVALPAHSVKSFNRAVVKKSSMIAGRSEKLIMSLIRNGFGQTELAGSS
jgi:hypothetical protein